MPEQLADKLAEIISGYVGEQDWLLELAEKVEAEARRHIAEEGRDDG